MRVMITGATGFLGSHLARQLDERGDEVVVLVRATSDRTRLAGVRFREVVGDVTDAESVRRAVDGVDQVLHCAGIVEFGPRDRTMLDAVNVEGTRNVLGAAVAAGVPAVHVSSLAALGASEPGQPAKDETWWNPGPSQAVYEETKRAAHLHARSLAAAGGAIRIVMPGGIYGLGDQSTLYDLVRTYALWPVPMGYFAEVRQSTVHVDDCADAILRVADRGTDGREYVVAAETATIRAWITLIAEGGGHRPPRWYLPTSALRRFGPPVDRVVRWCGGPPNAITETIAVAAHDNAYSGERLRTELGWEPRSLADGMAELAGQIRAEREARRIDGRLRRVTARGLRRRPAR